MRRTAVTTAKPAVPVAPLPTWRLNDPAVAALSLASGAYVLRGHEVDPNGRVTFVLEGALDPLVSVIDPTFSVGGRAALAGLEGIHRILAAHRHRRRDDRREKARKGAGAR